MSALTNFIHFVPYLCTKDVKWHPYKNVRVCSYAY